MTLSMATFIKMTSSIVKVLRMTVNLLHSAEWHSTKWLNKMTFKLSTLYRMTFKLSKLFRMAFSISTFIRMINIVTLGRMTFSITSHSRNNIYQNALLKFIYLVYVVTFNMLPCMSLCRVSFGRMSWRCLFCLCNRSRWKKSVGFSYFLHYLLQPRNSRRKGKGSVRYRRPPCTSPFGKVLFMKENVWFPWN
jgi:hypothetical protein